MEGMGPRFPPVLFQQDVGFFCSGALPTWKAGHKGHTRKGLGNFSQLSQALPGVQRRATDIWPEGCKQHLSAASEVPLSARRRTSAASLPAQPGPISRALKFRLDRTGGCNAPSWSWTASPPTGFVEPTRAEGEQMSSSIYAASIFVICKHGYGGFKTPRDL